MTWDYYNIEKADFSFRSIVRNSRGVYAGIFDKIQITPDLSKYAGDVLGEAAKAVEDYELFGIETNDCSNNESYVPSANDTVYANSYTVTIDQNINLTGSTVDQSGSFIPGHLYQIVSVGTTNFTLVANCILPGTNAGTAVAISSTVGTIFQAVNAGTATTGTARRMGALFNHVNTPLSIVTGGGFVLSSNFICVKPFVS